MHIHRHKSYVNGKFFLATSDLLGVVCGCFWIARASTKLSETFDYSRSPSRKLLAFTPVDRGYGGKGGAQRPELANAGCCATGARTNLAPSRTCKTSVPSNYSSPTSASSARRRRQDTVWTIGVARIKNWGWPKMDK